MGRISKPARLGAICVALVVLAGWQLVAKVGLSLPPQVPEIRSQTAAVENVSAPMVKPREAYSEIEDRPLFVATRRPPVVITVKPASVVQTQTLERYSVVGIIAASDHATALIRGLAGETLHLRVGQALEGWTLEDISPGKLVFDADGQKQEIVFQTKKPRPGQNAR